MTRKPQAQGMPWNPETLRERLILALAQADGQDWPEGADDHTANVMYGHLADAAIDTFLAGPEGNDGITDGIRGLFAERYARNVRYKGSPGEAADRAALTFPIEETS